LTEELGPQGLDVLAVALDASPEAARPWIEAARPTYPALIDVRHVVADLYHMVNVPSVVWIDEAGRLARPRDVAFGSDRFRERTGIDSARHLTALRRWVRGERPAATADEVRARLSLPTDADQAARAEFGLGQWLWSRDRGDAAARHFARAGELAPHQFTIRRGTMPMRGQDPFGPDFRGMWDAWAAAGQRYYRPLPD
jgi:hypothetical protein